MFSLQDHFITPFTQERLEETIEAYKRSLEIFPFQGLENKSTFGAFSELKRSKCQVGPYQNISLFEAANRIFSDLVLLDGARKIFEVPSLIEATSIESMQLAASNISGLDLEIGSDSGKIIGEAYNTAPSFFKQKSGSEIRKHKGKTERFVLLFNEDALDESGKNLNYIEGQVTKHASLIGYVTCGLEDWKNY